MTIDDTSFSKILGVLFTTANKCNGVDYCHSKVYITWNDLGQNSKVYNLSGQITLWPVQKSLHTHSTVSQTGSMY